MAYLVEHDGKTLGPFSRDELLQRLGAGEIARTDLACDEYHGRWTPLGELLDAESAEPKTIPPLPGHKRGTFSAIGWGSVLGFLYFFYRVTRLMYACAHPHLPVAPN